MKFLILIMWHFDLFWGESISTVSKRRKCSGLICFLTFIMVPAYIYPLLSLSLSQKEKKKLLIVVYSHSKNHNPKLSSAPLLKQWLKQGENTTTKPIQLWDSSLQRAGCQLPLCHIWIWKELKQKKKWEGQGKIR